MEGLFSWRFTLWIPGRRYPRKAAAAVNRILFLLALPILVGGGLIYINNYSDAMAAAWDYGELITAGLLLGLAAGIFFMKPHMRRQGSRMARMSVNLA